MLVAKCWGEPHRMARRGVIPPTAVMVCAARDAAEVETVLKLIAVSYTPTGLVTFNTAPASGVEVTAEFEFDVPVRFDADHMAGTIESYTLHAWQQIPIVEFRG